MSATTPSKSPTRSASGLELLFLALYALLEPHPRRASALVGRIELGRHAVRPRGEERLARVRRERRELVCRREAGRVVLEGAVRTNAHRGAYERLDEPR